MAATIRNRLRTFYYNLRIRNKILLILSLTMALFLAMGLITMRLTFYIYRASLYEQAYSALSLITTNIEHDLQNIDTISYEMVGDSNVQQYVEDVKNSKDPYKASSSLTSLLGQLSTYTLKQPFISGVNFIDTHGVPSTIGLLDSLLQEPNISFFADKAAQAHGSGVFAEPGGESNSLYLARQIRAVPNVQLTDMGTIVIQCDISKIVSTYLNVSHDQSACLIITDGQNQVFRSPQLPAGVSGTEASSTGYAVKKIGGRKYFMVSSRSAYMGWRYVYTIPYDLIFHRVVLIQWMELLVFFLAFVAVTLLGTRFAISLTRPFEKLTAEIRMVETGNFKIPEDGEAEAGRQDEIGVLQHDFSLMIRKIDELITDNYIKQLTIKDTQMKALQAQINPHFLYNTLESINWMAKINRQPHISLMAESLGQLLRGALKVKGNTIPVEKELHLLQCYIAIQQIRYENRLDFHLVIEERLRVCQIPQLTLQPIVENSIAYGLEQMAGPCTIRVSFSDDESGVLFVRIEDNGPGIQPDLLAKIQSGTFQPRGFGIGLKNIRDRLRLIYGEKAGIQVDSLPGRGTSVTVWMPKRI